MVENANITLHNVYNVEVGKIEQLTTNPVRYSRRVTIRFSDSDPLTIILFTGSEQADDIGFNLSKGANYNG